MLQGILEYMYDNTHRKDLTDLTLEATGDHSKLQAIIQLLQKFGIKELARTGTLAVRRTMQSDDI